MEHLLIVGLGNPGSRYQNNRHNIGFMIVDELISKFSLSWKDTKKYEESSTNFESLKVHFLKPKEYMNLSGNAVGLIAKTYKIPAKQILVVQDEVDIPFGKIKNKIGGGTAGHNGLKDIVEKIGSSDFHRLRFGVGKPEKGQMEVADFVLQNFNDEERQKLGDFIQESVKKCEDWIKTQLVDISKGDSK
ncbi:MAG: aminoacyl-tRNA hydrolase [Leptospira sp.]|nr:aminoacyl-tRNA hydrolase [Leptospira sp.]